MSRKPASDSLTAAKDIMSEALRELSPPDHEPLFDGAEPYWNEIITARAKVDWAVEDLTIAAKLANVMLMHKDEQALLFDEDTVYTTQGGNKTANPRVQVVRNFANEIKAWRTDLQIHGRGKNGEPRDVGKKRGIRKAVEKGAVKSRLIARPND